MLCWSGLFAATTTTLLVTFFIFFYNRLLPTGALFLPLKERQAVSSGRAKLRFKFLVLASLSVCALVAQRNARSLLVFSIFWCYKRVCWVDAATYILLLLLPPPPSLYCLSRLSLAFIQPRAFESQAAKPVRSSSLWSGRRKKFSFPPPPPLPYLFAFQICCEAQAFFFCFLFFVGVCLRIFFLYTVFRATV